uniref:(northern house mosquito) hypothetical protein n=1 Tax=Culex pipiens TaxID=7175 RepID=A0A8D8N117_CULPI
MTSSNNRCSHSSPTISSHSIHNISHRISTRIPMKDSWCIEVKECQRCPQCMNRLCRPEYGKPRRKPTTIPRRRNAAIVFQQVGPATGRIPGSRAFQVVVRGAAHSAKTPS